MITGDNVFVYTTLRITKLKNLIKMENNKELKTKKQCDIRVVIPRTCSTCAHEKDSRCMLSGYHTTTERAYPRVCGRNFEGWEKRLGVIDRLKYWLYGV